MRYSPEPFKRFNVNILLFFNHHRNLPSFPSVSVSLDLIVIIPYLQTISSLSPPRAPHNYSSPLKMANAWGKKYDCQASVLESDRHAWDSIYQAQTGSELFEFVESLPLVFDLPVPFSLFINPSSPTLSTPLLPYPHTALWIILSQILFPNIPFTPAPLSPCAFVLRSLAAPLPQDL